MFSIFFKQSLFLISFFLFGYILGRTILRSFRFSSKIEDFGFTIVTGWGILAFSMILLGFWGLFRPVILFTALAIIFITSLISTVLSGKGVGFCRCYSIFKNLIHNSFILSAFGFIILYFILLFYISLYPITECDAIMYHLPVAREFIARGKIVTTPFLRFPVFPELIELFFALALMLGETLYANLTQYAMALVLFLLIYSFGKRYFNQEIGLFSAILFISSPIVSKLAVIPYVEIGTTLFCFSAFYAMCIWIDEKKLSYAILSALFWGLAFGSKYHSILFFSIAFLMTIILFNKKVNFYQGILMLLLSVLIAFPWYFRNWIYSGDWFFPMRPITGIWHSADVTSHANYLRSFGLGRNTASFLMLPINLLRYSNAYQGNIGLLIIGIGSLFFIKKWSRLIALCTTIVIIYCLFWYYNFQIVRFLCYILPLVSLLGGWTIQKVNDYLSLKDEWFFGFLIITVLLFGCFNCIEIIKNNGPIPVTTEQKIEYIAGRIPTFKAINFLNNMGQTDKVVYSLYDEGAIFYHKNKVIGDWFGLAAYRYVSPYLSKPDLLHHILTHYGAKYFLINRNRVHTIDQSLFKTPVFRSIYNDKFTYIFEIL